MVRAMLALAEGTDPRAPGGAVTVALCGSWEHDPPCRWPHNSDIVRDGSIRTIFAAPSDEALEVRGRIEAALRGDARWRVLLLEDGTLTADERALGERLAAPA